MSSSDNKLQVINHLVNAVMSDANYNPPLNIHKLLLDIVELTKEDGTIQESKASSKFEYNKDAIYYSVDASIVKNPGGPSSIGCVVREPGLQPMAFSRISKGTTNNQAEMLAIGQALSNIESNKLRYQWKAQQIEIHSDSQLIVDFLNSRKNISDEELLKVCTPVKELFEELLVLFSDKLLSIKWLPRCSTPDLKLANDEAQRALGVKVH